MSGVFSKIAPCLIVLLALAAACLPTEGGPRNTLPASSPSTAASDAGGLKVHSGEVTKVSDSEYVLRTASNLNGDFYEAYFDFPVSLDQPFIIKLDVDYPASDIEDTVEVFLGDNSFGYQRATAAYWNDFYTSIQKRRLKIQKKMEIEEYNFGQKNTFAINAVDIASENYKNIFYQVFMNYLVSEEYNTPYKKDFRFG
ncbi:MAG: hypothetical protein LBE31_01660, partial [Deltaproteobacteria bacterium]|nr:hypothetical protein [Deltaproteobacteria bacterium]